MLSYIFYSVPQGLKFPECHWSVDRKREEILYYGALQQGQPQDPLLRVSRPCACLLPPVLFGV